MNIEKKYYKYLDLIRVLACLAVLLYHFNVLKGGYLAVCIFFTLSGYLSCISLFKREKFSFRFYFLRLLKLYIPLLITVFLTITIISFFPNITWVNLKPETTSVLFGYNNFWQLNANLDYFARHVNSPFIHLWYVSILLQFDLVIPFIYILFRKIGDKIHKLIPCFIIILLAIISYSYFYKMSFTSNIMFMYYNTLTRIFSLLLGFALGFIHSYYASLVVKPLQRNPINKIIFYSYLIIIAILCILVDSTSIYMPLSMLLITLITCRLIDYGTITDKENLSIWDKIVKFLSSISYEVYLLQYPVIFLFQYIDINAYWKVPIMIVSILLLSLIIHFAINFRKNGKIKVLRVMLTIFISIISLYGAYQYFIAKDYSSDMKQLENQLLENEKLIKQKQEEYALKAKQEEDDWLKQLSDLEMGEEKLKEVVSNLNVVGIGDSIMLGAVDSLYNKFPNGYFNADISRTAWVANDILQNLKNRNILGNPIIINLGANGDCTLSCKMEIMNTIGTRQVFWLNVTNDYEVHVNDNLISFANKYSNVHIIDWDSISKGHNEYFVYDGIHLTETGVKAYTDAIYDAIYQVYLEEYQKNKEEIIQNHDEIEKKKISFYGNDVLLNAFDYLQNNFNESKFIIRSDFTYDSLKMELEETIQNKSLTNRIVLAFDGSINFSKMQYQDLIKLCNGHEIYILAMDRQAYDNLLSLNDNSVTVINFYQELLANDNYLMADKVHLTNDGNIALSKILIDRLTSSDK